jgi:hypothetical protein
MVIHYTQPKGPNKQCNKFKKDTWDTQIFLVWIEMDGRDQPKVPPPLTPHQFHQKKKKLINSQCRILYNHKLIIQPFQIFIEPRRTVERIVYTLIPSSSFFFISFFLEFSRVFGGPTEIRICLFSPKRKNK